MYFLGATQYRVKKWMEQLSLESAECEKKNRKLTITLFTAVPSNDLSMIREKAEALWDDITSIEFE